MNAVLEAVQINYAFKVNPKDREKKAPGNVVRKMLWTKDVMLDLLAARYGEPSSAEERQAAIASRQPRGRRVAGRGGRRAASPRPLPRSHPCPSAEKTSHPWL